MTDISYKKYSLENLENWLHDAISSDDATPREIYDVIISVVKESHDYHKGQVDRAYELMNMLNDYSYENSQFYIPSNSFINSDSFIDFSNPTYTTTEELNTSTSDIITFKSCNSDDTSSECITSWNDFWSDDTIGAVEDFTFTPSSDKIVKWQLPVQVDGLTGECYINLPDDLLERAGLKEGDTVEWIDLGNGSFEMRKVSEPLKMDEC